MHVMILDTRVFPPGTFVQDVELMRAITSDSEPHWQLQKYLDLRQNPRKTGERYYFGEYLCQGDLDIEGHWEQITMDKVVSLGLYEL